MSDKQIEELEERIEELETTLERLRLWARAYPLKIFPEPDLKRAADALNVVGITLDAVSASAMRHVLTQITEMIDNTQSAPPPETGADTKPNTGDFRRARGVVPWKEGDPRPEEVIAKVRGRKVDDDADADGGAG